MLGVILYFSGTGNTKYVVDLMKQAFEKKGCKIETYSLEEAFELEADTYDFLVLGFPKYYEYVPLQFIELIKHKIPTVKTCTKTLVFCTQCGPTKVPTRQISKLLKHKNHDVTVTSLFQLANNFFLVKAFPPTSDFEIKVRNFNAKSKVDKVINLFLNGETYSESMGKWMDTCCGYFVSVYKHTIPKDVKQISTTSSCTKCGLCIKRCPMKNIIMTDEGPKLQSNCMMCMRCLNTCSANAFQYKHQTLPQYVHLKMKK